MRRFFILLAVFWLGLAAIFLLMRHRYPFNAPRTAEMLSHVQPQGDALPELWPAPDFRFANQDGEPVSRESLAGHVWVADFFYSQCTAVCPLLTAQFVQLQRKVAAPDVRFVSFSVDPAHDTPEVLRQYAASWGNDARWQLLSTTAAELPALAAGMRVSVKAGPDSANAIIHSSVFLLVDAQGKVRGAYESGSPQALARLAEDAQRLAASAAAGGATAGAAAMPAAATAEARGEALYQAMGCAGCHLRPTVAPPLDDLVGATIMLASGEKVTGDEAYLRESLLAPGGKMVAGYLGLMPSYAWSLDEGQLDDVVAYLKSRHRAPDPGGTASAGKDVAAMTIDPVCDMLVRAIDETPHADYQGKTYYFCCEMCRDDFVADPGRYLAAKRAGKEPRGTP